MYPREIRAFNCERRTSNFLRLRHGIAQSPSSVDKSVHKILGACGRRRCARRKEQSAYFLGIGRVTSGPPYVAVSIRDDAFFVH
ncbi:hypothetical protein NITMOv2_2275 [Nitrospira moscoviensis]|uniref:Uncharacterized protein n=1 Tax=Nitrospira moscoviensis TaxID=42253 RepID=A0A0K2GCK3_NITMO|nr:hypothetical protein NITMOv2_2275 [Nitrospira moscoviensis]